MRNMGMGLLLALVLAAPVCAEVDRSLSDQMLQKLKVRGPITAAEHGQAVQVFSTLLPFTQRRDVTYRLELQQSQDLDAHALPDGRIVVDTALLDSLQGDANAVAFTEAQELSYVESHAADRKLDAQLGSAGVVQHMVPQSNQDVLFLTLAADQLLNAGYASQVESAADANGLELMRRAGYDPNGALVVFDVLKANEGTSRVVFPNRPPATQRYMAAVQWMRHHNVAVIDPIIGYGPPPLQPSRTAVAYPQPAIPYYPPSSYRPMPAAYSTPARKPLTGPAPMPPPGREDDTF